MSKGEISELSGDDVAEFEPRDTARYQSRAEAPQVRAPAETLSPPTAPVTPAPELQAAAKARWRPSLRLALMAAGILVVAIGSFTYWLRGGRYASSDDAYIEYAKAQVTTDVSGIVTKVDVHEGEVVKPGQILFQLDPLQYQIALQNAHANLHEVALTIQSMKSNYQVTLSNVAAQQAQVAFDQVTFDRDAALVPGDTIARQTYDQARYTLQLDRNKLVSLQQQVQVELAKLAGNPNIPLAEHPLYRQAKAQVDEAQRQLDHASVRAPFSGVVTQVDALQPGTYLVAQTAAMTQTGAIALVSDNQVWVTAQMKETDLTYVRPGNHVEVTVDTYPGQVWSGTVVSISPASSSEFSVLPAQNSSGNWVKVVQRVQVKIALTSKPGTAILRSGMSVYVSIDTGHHRSLADLF
jgi:membrane fusion protein (multidrug efflux system)